MSSSDAALVDAANSDKLLATSTPSSPSPAPTARDCGPSPAFDPLIKENEKDAQLGHRRSRHRRSKRYIATAAAIALALTVVALAVILPVYFTVIRPRHLEHVQGANGSGSGPVNNPFSPTGAITGGDGSIVVTENGTQFTYRNPFNGYWVQDPSNPYNNDARPNSWTPPLNTTWKWGVDRIYGVNIGGWLVMEPFITPSLYQKYPGAVDEWTLSVAMRNDTSEGGGITQLERHYDTFIAEQDIAEMAGAGLNWIRVPIPFWAIEVYPGEPFLERTAWNYFLRLLGWARKYGLRVCLDLHTIPGSQNGYNHSGRLSPVNFLSGNMGLANAQRTLYYIRILAEFISQPEYRDLIPMFGIVNEALVGIIGMDAITSFYLEAYNVVREVGGFGAGNGPLITIHDGFQGFANWKGFLAGADRLAIEQHPYFSFGGQQLDPIAVLGADGLPGGTWTRAACTWGPVTNDGRRDFGITIAGEFSAAPNDCGLFLHGVGQESTNPQCPIYDSWESYNATMKEGIQNVVMASMDALGDWFFWTWKIGPSKANRVETPLWSYQLGLRNGWIPQDPRVAQGRCAPLGVVDPNGPFDGKYQPWQTGEGPFSIAQSSSAQFPWPPKTILNADVPVSLMPTYTDTGSVITLPATSTIQGASNAVKTPAPTVSLPDGWFNNNDNKGGIVPVQGCSYPDEYFGAFKNGIPIAPCTGEPAMVTRALDLRDMVTELKSEPTPFPR